MKDISAYLADLETSPVRTLKELITFNEDHAREELPPGESSLCTSNHGSLQKSGHDNQDILKSSYELSVSPEEYQANFDHMRHIGRDRGLDQIFDKYGVDVLTGQIDSKMMSYAACAGKSILEMVIVRNSSINGCRIPYRYNAFRLSRLQWPAIWLMWHSSSSSRCCLTESTKCLGSDIWSETSTTPSGCRPLAEFQTHQILSLLRRTLQAAHFDM